MGQERLFSGVGTMRLIHTYGPWLGLLGWLFWYVLEYSTFAAASNVPFCQASVYVSGLCAMIGYSKEWQVLSSKFK